MNRKAFERVSRYFSIACALGLLWVGTAAAQDRGATNADAGVGRGAGIAWQALSADQKQLLAGMERQWNRLPPGRQIALANGANRFIGMNGNQRLEANRRFEQWNGMTDAERAVIAQRFAEFRSLSPRDKARIRQNARRFDRMTLEQRQLLRRRFQNLTPEERARTREQLRERPLPLRP